MFESLANKFQDIRKRIFSSGYLTEKNIEEGLREIRTALLEADVNYKVVKGFINRVQERAVGEDVIKNISPGQQIVKIVSDELTSLMGPADSSIQFAEKGPTIIMMAGLQGSGKTTTCGKLASHLLTKDRRPLLVAADIQRPAAIEQLQILGKTLDVPVFSAPKLSPPKICQKAISFAGKENCDVVILDTAGRLHIDQNLMDELGTIQKKLNPHNIFFVCDAMTGQDAINSTKEFNSRLELDGIILTKLDGDTRGGAALSIKAVTGKPIKFIGTGEKLDRLEEFHPDRMASRILGMGDVVSLVERAEEIMDQEQAEEMQQKILDASFSLEDFLDQLQNIKKMGNIRDLLGMLPGELGSQLQGVDIDESQFVAIEAIIHSMTPEERQNPDIIDGKRRTRIARGSGSSIQDVNQLLRQFREMRNMMRNIGKFGGMMGNMMPGFGGKTRIKKKRKKKAKR